MSRTTLGELEEVVLLSLLHLGGKGYAAEIVEAVADHAGRSVSSATAYMVLRRLQDREFVESYLGDPLPERGGRPRRYFAIRETAMPLLREARAMRLALWTGLEEVMDRTS